MDYAHVPVLLAETLEALRIRPDGVYVDGTAGGGGHSLAIAKQLQTGRLIAMDRDPDAVAAASARLRDVANATVIPGNFANMGGALDALGVTEVNGVLLDLGVSSYQLDEPERGFSYHKDAPLDMRMSKEGSTAADLVNRLSVEELTKILTEYGEERYAYRIANQIAKSRQTNPITTTAALAEAVKRAVPAAYQREGHPARRTFQALRIAVNGELDALAAGLEAAFARLCVGGELVVISFHSLEDRIVKRRFAEWTKGCTCPPDFPVCVCGKTPQARLSPPKAIKPGAEEMARNPRSRSAVLRGVEKLK